MSIGSIGSIEGRPPPAPIVPTPGARARAADVTAKKEIPDEPSPFARMLHGIGQEMNRGEATMRAAMSAGDMGGPQLLALQVGVYRYSEAVDLASKLVDRVSGGVKTVLQGQ